MQVLNIFHVLVAIAMVAFILVQRGPGATAGAAFGSGASGTVFGSRGAGSFLSRTTWILATFFCVISLVMAVMVSRELTTPQTDLGVVAGTPAAQEVVEQPAFELPADEQGATEQISSDLPVLDTQEQDTEAGDLPELEPEAADETGAEPDSDG